MGRISKSQRKIFLSKLRKSGFSVEMLSCALDIKKPTFYQGIYRSGVEYLNLERRGRILEFFRKKHPELVGPFCDLIDQLCNFADRNLFEKPTLTCSIQKIEFVESKDSTDPFTPFIHIIVNGLDGFIDGGNWCIHPKSIYFSNEIMFFSGERADIVERECSSNFSFRGEYNYKKCSGEISLFKNKN
jgi:hypothetical protein